VSYNPLAGRWARSGDADVNYMMTVVRRVETSTVSARSEQGMETAG
jgi:hypothetical protein